MKRVLLLGATGSIGRQTLDIAARHPDRFTIVGLQSHADAAGLSLAAKEHPGAVACLSGRLDPGFRYSGPDSLRRLVVDTEADIVVNAVAGSAGLMPSLWALRSGKDLALANKETIVMAGRLVLEEAARLGRAVLPVDSEHSAIFNLIERIGRDRVREIVITASGGAFRDEPIESLERKTPADALAHPTWSMGAKITIDSATMANKGLEVIEAARLFKALPTDIRVVIHPESRVHSLVRTLDGSLYAQLSRPDMRLPILNALTWPDVAHEDVADLDLCDATLRFYAPDPTRYPLLGLAYEALRAGEGATCAYNAANEVAVEAFSSGRIGFTRIADVTRLALSEDYPAAVSSIEEALDIDATARRQAERALKELA